MSRCHETEANRIPGIDLIIHACACTCTLLSWGETLFAGTRQQHVLNCSKGVRKIKEELLFISPARIPYVGHTLVSSEGDGWLISSLHLGQRRQAARDLPKAFRGT